MTRDESDGIVAYIAAIYGLRPTDASRAAWWDQIGDLPADAAMDAVRQVMREQDSRSWPLISHIRAKVVAEMHPGGISPAVRHTKGCGRCVNGIVVLARTVPDLGQELYDFVYRCRCPAGRARPETCIPFVPDWALEEPPGSRREPNRADTEAARQVFPGMKATGSAGK